MKKAICSLCGQKTEIFTTAYRHTPFVDGEKYLKLCFSCFFVPKNLIQIYDENGLVKEEDQISCSCSNLSTPKELLEQGSADSLKEAKISFLKIKEVCLLSKKKKEVVRPKPNWQLSDD